MSDSQPRRDRPTPPPAPEPGEGGPPSPSRAGHRPPPPPTIGYAPPESLAGPGRPPVWVWPSIAFGLIYPALARSARLDAHLIERLPDPPTNLRRLPSPYQTLLVGFVVVVAVFFALLRGGGTLTTELGLGIDVVFTESYPYMLLALIIGMASPSAGLLLVLLHIPFDLIASAGLGSPFGSQQLEPPLTALAGRAVSWWLLWLLAVGIPLMSRSIPGAVLAGRQPRDRFQRTVLAYAAAAIIAGILLWMWTAALPFLVRPVFAWTVLGVPTDPAVQPIQSTGHVIIAAGIALVLAITALRQQFGVLEEEVHEIGQPEGAYGDVDFAGRSGGTAQPSAQPLEPDEEADAPLFSEQLELLGKVVIQAFAIIALGGIVTGALDVAILFGAAVFGQLAAGRLARWAPLAMILTRVPWVIRFIAAFAVTYVIGNIVNLIVFEPVAGSEFFPLVLTAAIGLALFRVVLGAVEPSSADAEPEDQPRQSAGVATGVLLAAVVLGGLAFLAAPGPVSAGNCSGWGDCPVTMEAVAAAGAGSAAVVALSAALAAARSEEPREKEKRRRRRRRRPPGGPGGEPPVASNLVDRLRERALRNYHGQR